MTYPSVTSKGFIQTINFLQVQKDGSIDGFGWVQVFLRLLRALALLFSLAIEGMVDVWVKVIERHFEGSEKAKGESGGAAASTALRALCRRSLLCYWLGEVWLALGRLNRYRFSISFIYRDLTLCFMPTIQDKSDFGSSLFLRNLVGQENAPSKTDFHSISEDLNLSHFEMSQI